MQLQLCGQFPKGLWHVYLGHILITAPTGYKETNISLRIRKLSIHWLSLNVFFIISFHQIRRFCVGRLATFFFLFRDTNNNLSQMLIK